MFAKRAERKRLQKPRRVLADGVVALCRQEKRIGISIPHHGFDFRLGLQQAVPPDFIVENIDGIPARVTGGNESSKGVPEQAQNLGRILLRTHIALLPPRWLARRAGRSAC